MARASLAVAVLVALAVPVGAPWSEAAEEVAAAAPSSVAAMEIPAVADAPALPKVSPPPTPSGTPPAESCRLGLLVTVTGWTKHEMARRTLDVAGLGFDEGQLQVSLLGEPVIETPSLPSLDADLDLLLPSDVLTEVPVGLGDLQDAVALDVGASFEQVYYKWTLQQATFFVDASTLGSTDLTAAALGLAGLPLSLAPLEFCGDGEALVDALPEDVIAFAEMVASPGSDGWYTVLMPDVSFGLAVDGPRLT